ncbi:hypothetical protein NUW54_g3277 [Trametes sanguinea]|uniref:Uncharacterized protein n=1 Tax=Trametes sanguinea TaxID=158606 RepID=A0ACC1Q402_9APHY|nr:hypothetical protein NUW54_g3277 [Trametes sanguinea]
MPNKETKVIEATRWMARRCTRARDTCGCDFEEVESRRGVTSNCLTTTHDEISRLTSESRTVEQTVLAGLAPDGGLYIPEHIPSLPANWQSAWKDHSFVDLSAEILSLYISEEEISRAELRELVEKSYSTFRHPEVTPLKKLNDKTYVLELFHGPTFAFKDVALQLLGNLFEFFLKRRNARKAPGEKPEKLTVVGATSGDTGRYVFFSIGGCVRGALVLNFAVDCTLRCSAAIYGLRNKANISIFILHPKGRVSPIQEAQMTTVTDANVHNLAVQGTFDDCQVCDPYSRSRRAELTACRTSSKASSTTGSSMRRTDWVPSTRSTGRASSLRPSTTSSHTSI